MVQKAYIICGSLGFNNSNRILRSLRDEPIVYLNWLSRYILGLWEVCLNGFHDMRHQYDIKFYGCKHILLEEYDIIREELMPSKCNNFQPYENV